MKKIKTGKRKRRAESDSKKLGGILKILAIIFVLAGVGVGFIFLDKYVKETAPGWIGGEPHSPGRSQAQPGKILPVELEEPPAWLNETLRQKIRAAVDAGAGSDDRRGTKDEGQETARLIQEELVREVAWLENVRVQITHDKIIIQADFRRPIALVEVGMGKFYVDAKKVVLDYVPINNLPIVKVEGLSTVTKVPAAGVVWSREDLTAGVTILNSLNQLDEYFCPDKPLTYEIDSIDVSNFKGRKDKRSPHIVLYATDGTEIIWGAEYGDWAQQFEARDEEKLTKLYNYYKARGSLLNGARYIDLRDPQGKAALPIDRY